MTVYLLTYRSRKIRNHLSKTTDIALVPRIHHSKIRAQSTEVTACRGHGLLKRKFYKIVLVLLKWKVFKKTFFPTLEKLFTGGIHHSTLSAREPKEKRGIINCTFTGEVADDCRATGM